MGINTPGATWGIPSDVFWKLYVVAALGLLVVAIAFRIIFRPENTVTENIDRLTPPEVGMLAGGPGRAIAPASWSRTIKLDTLPLVILAMVGVVRIIFGVARDKPIGYLAFTVAGIVVCVALLRAYDERTRAARSAVSNLSVAHPYLSPRAKPAFTSYGPRLAGVSAALFAGSAVRRAGSQYQDHPGWSSGAACRRKHCRPVRLAR